MHEIEPFYNWRTYYKVEEDKKSVFYAQIYSEFYLTNTIYNHYIHPQWDNFGSDTLYLKILFVDYKKHFAIIEFIGEWNDLIENDITKLKQNIIIHLQYQAIHKFILITENVMNFFGEEDDYYIEWQQEAEEENGWIAIVNMPSQSKYEFDKIKNNAGLNYFEIDEWRTFLPNHLFLKISKEIQKLLK